MSGLIIVDPVLLPGKVVSVTARQAELALLEAGWLDEVEAFIATLDRVAQIEWRRASVVKRDHPLIAAVQNQHGWTDADVDEMFSLAETL